MAKKIQTSYSSLELDGNTVHVAKITRENAPHSPYVVQAFYGEAGRTSIDTLSEVVENDPDILNSDKISVVLPLTNNTTPYFINPPNIDEWAISKYMHSTVEGALLSGKFLSPASTFSAVVSRHSADIDANTLQATAIATSRDYISKIYDVFDSRDNVMVIPIPFLHKKDGLYLEFMNSSVSLTYVDRVSLIPTNLQVLHGGLDELASQVGGWEILDPIVFLEQKPSNQALLVIDAYLDNLVQQIADTVFQYQNKNNLSDLSHILICGPGSVLPGLQDKLNHFGYSISFAIPNINFTTTDQNDNINNMLYNVVAGAACTEVERYIFGSKGSAVDNSDSYIMAFPNLYREEARSSIVETRSQRNRIRNLALIFITALILIIAPLFVANSSLSSVKNTLNIDNQIVKSNIKQYNIGAISSIGSTVVHTLRGDEPQWTQTLNNIENSIPANSSWKSLNVSVSNGVIAVNAIIQTVSPNFSVVSTWIQSLNSLGAFNVQTGAFEANSAQSSNTITLNMSFDLPAPSVQGIGGL